jgi:acyl dehydratase
VDIAGAVGAVFDPVRFELGERLNVAAFARALDLDDRVLRSASYARRQGYSGRPVLPPMYAFFQTIPLAELEERLGFRWGKTLGAEIEFHGGVIAGEEDEVVGRSAVESAWEAEGRGGVVRQFLRLRTDFHRVDGALACRCWVLFVERTDAPARSGLAEPVEGPLVDLPPTADPGTPRLDARSGQELPTHRLGPVDRLRLARISVAIDNPDPIHLDDSAAQAAGLPSVIGQGSAAAGLLYEPVRRWAGMERVLTGSVRLMAPIKLGASLTVSGVVASLEEQGGRRCAVCQTALRDETGTDIARAGLRVLVS